MKTPDQEVLYFREKLDSYKFFIERTNDHWKDDLEKYKQTLNSTSSDYPFEGRRDLYASLDTEFPQYQRRANLMVLVAFFEDFLNQLSLSVQEYLNLKPEFSEFNEARGLDKAKKYLKKIASIDFPSELPEWNRIKNAQKIRNVIAHTDGHLHEELHKEHIDIINQSNGLEFNKYARIHLNVKTDYVLEIRESMRTFCTALYDEIKEMNKNNSH